MDNCHYYYFFITHYSWDYMGIIFGFIAYFGLIENYGGFKSYEIIVCCLITPLTLQERFETSLMGAMAGLEARE